MSNLNCLYYDRILQKTIPCILVPNKIYTDRDGRKVVNITYDDSKFTEYNTNIEELYRYSYDTIRIMDLYPNTNSDQLAYAQACIPNKIANISTFRDDELTRIYTLVEMIINNTTLHLDTFLKICDFISYEILFVILDHISRLFMAYIANNTLNEQNIGPVLAGFGGAVPGKIFVRLVYLVFSNYESLLLPNYNIQNIASLSDVIKRFNVIFPIPLDINILNANVIFLQNGGYLN